MPTLLFPDRDTLRLALASGAVPTVVATAPAKVGVDELGRLVLTPLAAMDRESLAALTRLGVRVLGPEAVGPTRAVVSWHELLSPQPVPFTPEAFGRPVLFEVPASRFAALAGEIRRLGKHPYSFRWLDDPEVGEEGPEPAALLRVAVPPYFTLARVLEDDAAGADRMVRAYVEQAPRVWVAAGFEQPLAEQIRPPEGQFVLIRPAENWRLLPEGPFQSEGLPAALPATSASVGEPAVTGAAPSVTVAWRLKDGRDGPAPELWVFHGHALARLQALARSLDERTASRLSFAVGRVTDGECLLLRVRPGKGAPPVLVGQPGFAPALKLPNLFLPAGTRLEPPARRDVVRQELAADPGRVVWLRPLGEGAFRAESVPEGAFGPLSGWVSYEAANAHRARLAWAEPVGPFSPEPFVIAPEEALANLRSQARTEAVPTDDPANAWPAPGASIRPGWIGRALGWLTGARRSAAGEPVAAGGRDAVDRPASPPELPAPPHARKPAEGRLQLAEAARAGDAQERCNALVARFLEKLAGLTADERLRLWPDLAACYDQLDSPADAAVCWLNALWERPEPDPGWAWGWLRAEAKTLRWSPHDLDLADALSRPPTPAAVRTLAAYAVWGALQRPSPDRLRDRLGALQAYLDAHDAKLPARAAWLAHLALARLAGGDVLGLARARDRLLQRLLQNGLSLDLDTPAFLRFASTGLRDRYQEVRGWLADKRELIHAWITQMGGGVRAAGGLQQFGLDVETGRTRGYADLVLAWGLARFSEHQANTRLRKNASQVLAGGDPVHAFLRAAFEHRIRQVEEGVPPRGALPAELLGQLERLPDDHRYRAEKLLEHSRILAPLERFNAYDPTFRPFQGFSEPERAAYSLAGVADPRELAGRIDQVLPALRVLPASARLKVAGRLLGNAPRAGEAAVARVLQEVTPLLEADGLPLAEQAELMEAGLFAAGHFDQGEAVRRLAAHLTRLFERPRPSAELARLPEPMEQAVRSLRRLGLRAEGDQILLRVADGVLQGQKPAAARVRLKGPVWGPSLRALLGVAAGWYYTGREEDAHAVIEEARKDLYTVELAPAEKTQLALTYARTLGNVPVRLALGRFEELFQRLKGLKLASSTDSHYNLQILRLVETVVRAIVHEDFTLGPAVRGWLDDDEYLVRQRIHGDLKAALGEHGV